MIIAKIFENTFLIHCLHYHGRLKKQATLKYDENFHESFQLYFYWGLLEYPTPLEMDIHASKVQLWTM